MGISFAVGSKMKKNIGFTLIELMVTIAVLAVIAMLAAPSFGNLIEGRNLKKSTQELAGVLNQARVQAALERSDVTVNLASLSSETIPADTETELNWKPSGNSELTSAIKSVTYNLTGGIDETAEVDFTICSKGIGKSSVISVSSMGTIHIAVEGTC